MESKHCNKCKELKSKENFTTDNRQKDKLSLICRHCKKENDRARKSCKTYKDIPPLPPNSKLICEIPEFSDFKGYCMDINGTLYSCRKRQFGFYGKWIKLSHSIKNGRKCYAIANNSVNKYLLEHRLLAMLFIPNPDNKPWINHIDSNPLNNKLDNVEWCTPKENSAHAIEFGFLPKGSAVKTSILKENQVIEIRKKKNRWHESKANSEGLQCFRRHNRRYNKQKKLEALLNVLNNMTYVTTIISSAIRNKIFFICIRV